MDKEINKYALFEDVLKLYFCSKELEQRYLKEAFIFHEKADNESLISGVRYDGVAGNGCSVQTVNYRPIRYNIEKAIKKDMQAHRYNKLAQLLDDTFSLEAKINALESDKRVLVYQYYKYALSLNDILKMNKLNITKQGLYNKIKKIVMEMVDKDE